MTSISEIFRRPPGGGWILLNGGRLEFGEAFPGLAERLLDLLDLSRPPYHLDLGHGDNPGVREIIDEFEILFGIEVEKVENPLDWPEAVQSGGLVIISGDGPSLQDKLADSLGETPPEIAEGTLVLMIGDTVAAIGSWYASMNENRYQTGLGWIENALILLTEEDPSESTAVRELLQHEARSYVLGLPENALIALGPLGQTEVWSEEPPRILLGAGWVDE